MGGLRSCAAAAVAVLALTARPAAGGSVLGIDLGSEFFKISLVKPGMPLDIVLNIESKRKTATMVGYKDGEQLFSGAAANTVRRHYRRPEPACAVARCSLRAAAAAMTLTVAPALLRHADFRRLLADHAQAAAGVQVAHAAPRQDARLPHQAVVQGRHDQVRRLPS